MKVIGLRGFRPIVGAAALAVALCLSAVAFAADLGEEDVNKAVAATIAERSKDGAFVFHDPKLDADLDLVYEQIKYGAAWKAMAGSPTTIFHDKDNDQKKYAIDFWYKPEGDKLTLMDIRVQKGPKQEGDGWIMVDAHVVVAPRAGASRRHGNNPRLAGDGCDLYNYIAMIRPRMATSRSRTTRPARRYRSSSLTHPAHEKARRIFPPALIFASPAARTNITTSIFGANDK